MAYNRFKKLAQLREELGIEDRIENWLPESLEMVTPTDFLLQNLSEAKEEALGTEKAKSEYIVAPVLKELRRRNPNKFSSFSGYQFNVDKKLKLVGFCDFILSANPRQIEIDTPIFFLVEAKNDLIENGLAQCGAEMFAAQIFNTQQNMPTPIVYGCVTDGVSWQFLKLEGNILHKDIETYYSDEMAVGHLLRVFDVIMNPFCDKIAAIK